MCIVSGTSIGLFSICLSIIVSLFYIGIKSKSNPLTKLSCLQWQVIPYYTAYRKMQSHIRFYRIKGHVRASTGAQIILQGFFFGTTLTIFFLIHFHSILYKDHEPILYIYFNLCIQLCNPFYISHKDASLCRRIRIVIQYRLFHEMVKVYHNSMPHK